MTELDIVDDLIKSAVERRLARWSDWIAKAPGAGFSTSVAWLRERYDSNEYHSIVLIDTRDDEGLATDKAICQLPEKERDAVIVFWTQASTVESMSYRCSCSVSTLYRRLARAYERLYLEFTTKKSENRGNSQGYV